VTHAPPAASTFRVFLMVAWAIQAGAILALPFAFGPTAYPVHAWIAAPAPDFATTPSGAVLLVKVLVDVSLQVFGALVLLYGTRHLGSTGFEANAIARRRAATALGIGAALSALGSKPFILGIWFRQASTWDQPEPLPIPFEDFLRFTNTTTGDFALGLGATVAISLLFFIAAARYTRFAAIASVLAVAAGLNVVNLWFGPWAAVIGLVVVAMILGGAALTRRPAKRTGAAR